MTPDWVLQQELADARNHRSERAAAWARHRQQVRDERVALAHRLNADRMRRLMAAAWGDDPAGWLSKWVRLGRDPSVEWGKKAVGGVRILAMSAMTNPPPFTIQTGRGKWSEFRPDVLEPPTLPFREQIQALIRAGACTQDQVMERLGGRKAADVPQAEHAAILADLRSGSKQDAPGGEA